MKEESLTIPTLQRVKKSFKFSKEMKKAHTISFFALGYKVVLERT